MQDDTNNVVFEETRVRSLVKTVTYRIISFTGTIVVSWLITRDIKQTLSLTLAIQAFLIVLYYASERVWDRVNWGRHIKTLR
jgi:uncharacterized membrane protein